MVYSTTTPTTPVLYATSPTTPVFGLRREIDRLFEDAFRLGHAGRGDWTPAVDVRETAQELLFAIEIPGIALNDVELTTENGVLTVRGERTEQRAEGEGQYQLAERSYGSFIRRFQLPQGVDNDEIKADVADGVLYVHVMKAALPQPKQINITAAPNGSKHTPKVIANVGTPVAPTKGNKALQPK